MSTNPTSELRNLTIFQKDMPDAMGVNVDFFERVRPLPDSMRVEVVLDKPVNFFANETDGDAIELVFAYGGKGSAGISFPADMAMEIARALEQIAFDMHLKAHGVGVHGESEPEPIEVRSAHRVDMGDIECWVVDTDHGDVYVADLQPGSDHALVEFYDKFEDLRSAWVATDGTEAGAMAAARVAIEGSRGAF